MKAIVFQQHGDPSVLHYTDVNEPHLRANDVLVRVRACALNKRRFVGPSRSARRADSVAPYSWERCGGRGGQDRPGGTHRLRWAKSGPRARGNLWQVPSVSLRQRQSLP